MQQESTDDHALFDQLNAGTRLPVFTLLIMFLGYGVGLGGIMCWMYVVEMRIHGVWPKALEFAAVFLFYCFMGGCLLMFLLQPLRLRLTPEGIHVGRWFRRGTRFVPWQEIQGASLSIYRSSVFLELRYAKYRNVTLALGLYKDPGAVYDAIAVRLGAPIRASVWALRAIGRAA